MPNNLLRNLPTVNELLESPSLKPLVARVNRNVVVTRVRSYLEDLRTQVQSAASDIHLPSVSDLAEKIAQRILLGEEPRLRPVINATGRLLDGGLGGPPLASDAVEDIVGAARDYASLDFDLDTGEPGDRVRVVEGLLQELTGAEAAIVVNSHAGAMLAALASLAAGREVLVSRGQLLEVDRGYRVPDVVTASGAVLREVGTTNITRSEDFRQAIGDRTAALLAVSVSNDAVAGANSGIELAELVRVGREHQVPLIHDLVSGTLVDYSEFGISGQPLVRDSVRAGAEATIFSGDRLLGGPQCGLIVGRREPLARIAAHPLSKALQVDKLTLSALAATLRLYRNPAAARREIPLLQLLGTSVENLKNRAERLAPQLAACGAVDRAEPLIDIAWLGQEELPSQQLPTWCIALTPAEGWSVDRLAKSLRGCHPAVIGRATADRLLLDLRSVFPRQDQQLVEALATLSPPKTAAPSAAVAP